MHEALYAQCFSSVCEQNPQVTRNEIIMHSDVEDGPKLWIR